MRSGWNTCEPEEKRWRRRRKKRGKRRKIRGREKMEEALVHLGVGGVDGPGQNPHGLPGRLLEEGLVFCFH